MKVRILMQHLKVCSKFLWVYLSTSSLQAPQKAEQEKYGIFFDDDYNYLQHLRGVREAVNWDDEDLEVYTIRCEDPQVTTCSLVSLADH